MDVSLFIIIVMIIALLSYISKRVLDIIEYRLKGPKRMDKYKRSDFIIDDFIKIKEPKE